MTIGFKSTKLKFHIACISNSRTETVWYETIARNIKVEENDSSKFYN